LVAIFPEVDKAPAAIQFVYVPAAGAVRSTFTVQELRPAKTPPANVTELLVLVTVPPHCEEAGAVATVTPVGKVSVIPSPSSWKLLVF